MKSNNNFNINEFTWLAILSLFAYYFYALMSSGRISLFIHPKMYKYVGTAIAALIIIIIFQIPKAATSSKSKFKAGYLIFLIPIIIGIWINPTGVTASSAEEKGVDITQGSEAQSPVSTTVSHDWDKEDVITMTEGNFSDVLSEVNGNPEKYKGRKITSKGFVFKDASLNKDEFVTARMLMTCCAADTQVVGFLCSYESQVPDKNAWIEVKGTLDTTTCTDKNSKQNITIPIIKVDMINNVEPSAAKYIYP